MKRLACGGGCGRSMAVYSTRLEWFCGFCEDARRAAARRRVTAAGRAARASARRRAQRAAVAAPRPARSCLDCQVDISARHVRAVRCGDCQVTYREMRYARRHERARALEPRSCLDCQTDITARLRRCPSARRCLACARDYRADASQWRDTPARSAVRAARRVADVAAGRARAASVEDRRTVTGVGDIAQRMAQALAEVRREASEARSRGQWGVDAYCGLGSSLCGAAGLVGGRGKI